MGDEDDSKCLAKNGLVLSRGTGRARTSRLSASRRVVAERSPNHVSSARAHRRRALRGEYCRPAALRRPGGSTRSNFASRARVEAPAARARPAASRRRRNMAYSTALRRRKRLAGSAVCRRGAVLGCCHGPRGLQKASATGTTRPPSRGRSKPTWEAAMRSPLGAPGARWNGERAPMGGGGVLLAPHRAPSVRTGVVTEGRLAQGLSRGRSAPSAVSRSRWSDSQWGTLVS